MKDKQKSLAQSASLAIAALCLFLYGHSFLQEPAFDRKQQAQIDFLANYIEAHDQDHKIEAELAASYWRRYADVKKNRYWGEKGPLGIWGPRDHFNQHGRREGRIFASLAIPEDLELEARLAREYWQRYPEIARDPIWGEESALGILGPRDHFRYRGRLQQKRWPGERK